jgi:hypothetical protein
MWKVARSARSTQSAFKNLQLRATFYLGPVQDVHSLHLNLQLHLVQGPL